ncbi:MAG: Lrp/AsnC family transcriptional regulator [Rhodospirillales bacterium]|nr:Lrp/AsnC family transcriptional regulator [Rhodospirillales bacterium]MDE2318214.1 Lrp/AsnC family transcriptional regulator [Rhodospirillales bacterium]
MINLDETDRKILNALQQDGRLSNIELAEKVNLSPSACLRRLHLLLQSDIVAGTHLVLDQKAAGFPGTAYVFITLEGQDRKLLDGFEARVKLIPQVQECYLLAGQADYLLRVVYNGAEDLERLHSEELTRLPGIRRVQSTLTLRMVKRTARLPL